MAEKIVSPGVFTRERDLSFLPAGVAAIGVRYNDNNPYDGTISEIQIYDTESSALTANVNNYLSNL